MNARWIILIYILKIHLKASTSQHHHHHHYYDDTLPLYDDEDDPDETEEFPEFLRRRTKHRRVDSEECYCTCDTCYSQEGPKPCCIEFCKYCRGNIQDPYANQEQKVVFVPFPYPLIVPNTGQNDNNQNTVIQNGNTQNNGVTSEKKQSEENVLRKAVTSPKPEVKTKIVKISPGVKTNKTKLRTKSVEVGMLSKHRQMKQLNPEVKRSRPAWVPKYGIVPIPDHLAAKLMTQLTEVRALKAKRL